MPPSLESIKLFSESLERFTLVFARSLRGARHGPRRFSCLGGPLTPSDALGRFLVERLGDRCLASLLAGGFDDHFPLIPALAYAQDVAWRDFPRHFDPLSFHLHLPALNGGFSKRSRFKKTCCPQPLIDADFSRAVLYFRQVQEDRSEFRRSGGWPGSLYSDVVELWSLAVAA